MLEEKVITEPKELLKIILDKYLHDRPDAFRWLMDFWQMCHMCDDVIDIPERRADNQFLGEVFNKYVDVAVSPVTLLPVRGPAGLRLACVV